MHHEMGDDALMKEEGKHGEKQDNKAQWRAVRQDKSHI